MPDRGPVEIEVQEATVTVWNHQIDLSQSVVARGADGFVAERRIDHDVLLDLGQAAAASFCSRQISAAFFDAQHRCLTLNPDAYRVVNQKPAHV